MQARPPRQSRPTFKAQPHSEFDDGLDLLSVEELRERVVTRLERLARKWERDMEERRARFPDLYRQADQSSP